MHTHTHTHTHTHLSLVGVHSFQVEPPSVLKEDGSILTLASKPEGDDSFLHIREISPVSTPHFPLLSPSPHLTHHTLLVSTHSLSRIYPPPRHPSPLTPFCSHSLTSPFPVTHLTLTPHPSHLSPLTPHTPHLTLTTPPPSPHHQISGRSWRTTGKWEVTSIVAVTSKDM